MLVLLTRVDMTRWDATGDLRVPVLREVRLSDVAGAVARGEDVADHGALLEGGAAQGDHDGAARGGEPAATTLAP